MSRITTQFRSTLGSHFAGMGITGLRDDEQDEYIYNGYRTKRTGHILPTDHLKEREDFNAYCQSQSGEVIVRHIDDLKEECG